MIEPVWPLTLITALLTCPAAAAEDEQDWSVHGQTTYTVQNHGAFTSPYAGANSLAAGKSTKGTFDATLFLGTRLWRGGELYLNPEVDQGFGLSDTLGVAGFPSGEAYKVGHSSPYLRLDRLFVRQRFDLGGETVKIEPDQNVLAASQSADNLTLTIGHFSVVDVFDANAYAHDSKSDFLNWSIIDAGAFDYAADAWGYSDGASLEWTRDWLTLRAGGFALSKVPNGETLDRSGQQHELLAEVELRGQLMERPGKLRLLTFINHGRMGRYADAIAASQLNGATPDVSAVQRVASRGGAALNLEYEASDSLGVFMRLSANDGAKQAYEFSDINRSVSAGFSLKGCLWLRCKDVLGLAVAVNQISSEAKAYFAAGGLGLLIGDGALAHPGPEQIVEIFYLVKLGAHIALSADLQHVTNVAYNRDRGPVNVYGLRAHLDF